MRVYVKYLHDAAEFDTLNILVEELTSEVSSLIYRFMQKVTFMLCPMAFAASAQKSLGQSIATGRKSRLSVLQRRCIKFLPAALTTGGYPSDRHDLSNG